MEELEGPDVSSTGGDIDADQCLAEVSGEEAVGGTTSTPDQNVVDELARSAGVEIADKRTLHISEMVEQRDAHRWDAHTPQFAAIGFLNHDYRLELYHYFRINTYFCINNLPSLIHDCFRNVLKGRQNI